jgi:thioredoxin reductase (NADPH)
MSASDSTKVENPLRLRLLGTHGSSTAYSLRDFLYRSNVPFEWIELTTDQQARELAQVSNLQERRLPVCLFPDGGRLDCPSLRQIAEKLGWFQRPSSAEYDLAISAPARPASVLRFTPHPRVSKPY